MRKLTEEHKKKISEAHKGKTPKNFSEFQRKGHIGASGIKPNKWVSNPTYVGIHAWVRRMFGKAKVCSKCGKVGTGYHIHWANISGNYLRDASDWFTLCVSCHWKYDGITLARVRDTKGRFQ